MDIDHLEVEIGADIDEFNRKIDTVERKIGGLGDGSLFDGLSDSFKGLTETVGGFEGLIPSSPMEAMIKGLSGFVIAGTVANAVGILAGALGALASQLTLAGAGLVGFGIVATPIITKLFELNEKLNEGEIKWSQLTKAQQGALTGLQEFKTFFDEFAQSFETPILQTFTNSLGIIRTVLTELQPMIQSVSDTMVELTTSLSKNLNSEDVQEFFAFLNEQAAPAIENLTKGVGNFIAGFGSMMEAFGPLGEDFSEGFLQMSEDFRKWAQDIENNDQFKKFIKWVRENGPDLLNDLENIAEYLYDVAVELGKTGDAIIDFLGWLADLSNDFQDTVDTISGIIDGIDWADTLENIGVNMIEGLINGMGSMLGEVESMAGKIAAAAARATAAFLGIHSPSRLFMKYGDYIGQGLTIGMDDSIGDIEQSSRDLANATTYGGFRSASPERNTHTPNTNESRNERQPVALIIDGYEMNGFIEFSKIRQNEMEQAESRGLGYA